MGRPWKDRPLTDNPDNFPVQFGLLEEIGFLADRCAALEEAAEKEAAYQEVEKLKTYEKILAQLDAALGLYLDLQAALSTVSQLLPSKGRLGRLFETPETARLKAEVSRLQGKKWKLIDRVTQLRKQFWATVLALDSEAYPYDPDYYGQHIHDIERESFEL